ncbi:MAG: DUF790 family protein [Magnetococcales bacterium]|nr:DUF790 family protein [Magnetococcales bacterium]
MLTKDLLRFDQRSQKVYPRFLDTQNKNWQEVAQSLAAIYESGSGYSREELGELALPVLNSARSPLVAKGLNKLLLDRCTFQESDAELETFRMQVFTQAARQFCSPAAAGCPSGGGSNNLETFRQRVADSLQMEPEALSARLYADLPARQSLLSFTPTVPEQLLHRYNLAQAQGLLWFAKQLVIETDEPEVGIRRQFFRRLKFFRLLARISRTPTGLFRIQLDGPLSLFENGRSYGLLLANFLPAVCALSRWRVQADIELPASLQAARQPGGTVLLELDHATGLKSHLTYTSSYVPEAFERFASAFGELSQEWKIQQNSELLELNKQDWVVPDFSFRHVTGRIVHLELFHRWHAGPLQRRLQSLDSSHRAQPSLAIGVDRSLTKQGESGAVLHASAWYQQHGFAFNLFPPVKRVMAALDGFLPTPAAAAVTRRADRPSSSIEPKQDLPP